MCAILRSMYFYVYAPTSAGRPQPTILPRTQRLDRVSCGAPHRGRSSPSNGTGGERTEERLAVNDRVLRRTRSEPESMRLVR